MGKVIQIILGLTIILAILGTLGVGIASLITVLNVQTQQAAQMSTGPPPSTTVNPIPAPVPIQANDPRFSSYKGMSDLLQTWMNRTVDPCVDFYAFTCGAGKPGQGMSFDISDNTITDTMVNQLRQPEKYFDNDTEYDGSINWIFEPLPVRQMKWFFDSCLTGATNDEKATRSKRIFTDLKTANKDFGFPALYPKDPKPVVDADLLASFLGSSLGTAGTTTLADVGVDTDWRDPHNSKGGYSLLVDQPATMFASTFYSKLYDADTVSSMVLTTLNQGAALLGITGLDAKQLAQDAKDIAQFDYDLATKYSTDDTTRRQYARSYNPYSVDGLQKLAPFINWKTFFNKGLAPVQKTVDGSFRSIVMEVDKLALLSADIASGAIPPRTVNNYLYFIALNQNYLPTLPTTKRNAAHLDEFRRQKHPINRKIRHVPKSDPMEIMSDYTQKESSCQNSATNYLMWANTRLYVDANYPSPKDKQTVRDQTNSIIRSILVAFRAQIDILDWMSPASKKGAYQKIDNLVVNIAFPDWGLVTTKDQKYLEQIDQLKAFQLYEAFSPLVNGVPADRTDFSGPSAITNAWYQPEVNSITFPGGILHAPFYDFNYPAAINYGGLGVIAGHELTHGFDDEGVQWEGTGILNSWMDDNSTVSFTKMAKCVVDEYSNFCPLNAPLPCVDGDQTQGENIADNGGIQAAYKAFKAYEALNGPDPLLPGDLSLFNSDQLFFIGFAQVWCQSPPDDIDLLAQILVDPHSPSQYRVLGTVQNIPAFQKAFNCPAGSPYAPIDHCNVWTSEPTSGAPLNAKGEPIVPDNEVNIAPVERISPQDMDKYSAYQNALVTLRDSSNLTIDPCDDFYHYTCGNFPGHSTTFYDLDQENNKVINTKITSDDYQATIKASAALGKLKTLYDSCKKEAQHSTIAETDYLQSKVLNFRKYINQDVPVIGGTGTFDVSATDYGNVLGYLSFQLGIDTLVSPLVDTNWMDPQAANPTTTNGNQLFIDQATTYHVRAFYEDGNWEKQKPAYKSQVKTILEAYVKQDTTAALPADYDKMIDDALDLEKKIAITYSGTDAERRNYLRQWNPLKKNQMPPTVDWDAYFTFAPQVVQDWVTKDNKDIIMNEQEYTSKMFTYLGNQNDKDVINYLFIRLLLANSGVIPCYNEQCVSVMRELSVKNVPEHTGKGRIPSKRHPLPSFAPLNEEDADGVGCADEISVLPDAQGRVYIDARFPTDDDRKTIRDKTAGVMTNIVDAMKGMILQLDWMHQDAKDKAVKKASSIQVNVAFPDFILDNAKLDAKYADLVFANDDSYYAMLDKVTVYSINEQFKMLTAKKADRTDFLGQTATVNAWYAPELNSITFPAGILQQPFFDVNYPAGLNYGGLGVVAGHELTHGFDDEGVQWDFDGSLKSWMDKDSQDGFDNMAKCVIDEYSQFCPLPEDRSPHCTDGTRTQGENIADNGGIHSAWRAYQAHIELDGPDALFMDRVFGEYTENQMYFLNFAQVWCMQKEYLTESFVSGRLMTDPHSLGPYRVLGTLQNIPAFQANFNCPKGSTYAPESHCSVWVPTKMA
uniref:Peptidase n=1 Tax=Pristionchus pacificus TaxID=54126 RepID=A0A8R1UW65_PRIPA